MTTLTHVAIAAKIRRIFAGALGLELSDIGLDADLYRDLDCDDFARIEIVMAVEDYADLEIIDDAAEALKTPAQFIAYVAERMGVGESVG